MTAENSADLDLTTIADEVRAGRLSARTVLEHALTRAYAEQERLNCFIAIETDTARANADAIDSAVAAGRDPGDLAGAPLAHKDLFSRRGAPVSCGARLCQNYAPGGQSTALARLAEAGALNLGRLHMTELANGSTGHNMWFGHCRNPWAPDRAPGGSSSGTGAATAARAIAGGLGTDVGGSIRIPASMCGVVGLRPTQTRISRTGAMPLSFSLDCTGPLTKSVRDTARMLRVMAGFDTQDQTTSRKMVPDYERVCGQQASDLVVGIPDTYYVEGLEQDVASAFDEANRTLAAQGCRTVEVKMPDHEPINELWNVIQLSEVASVHARWLRDNPEHYSPQVRRRIETGLYISAADYLRAAALRAEITKAFLSDVFRECDVLLTPTLPLCAPKLNETDIGDHDESGQRDMSLAEWHAMILRISGFTRPASFLGLPAMTVPAGFNRDGLPVGVQFIGRPFDESTLVRLGDLFQRVTSWHRSAPPSAEVT